MNKCTRLILAAFILCSASGVYAGDIAGKWTAEFDSQVGKQKYTYEVVVDGSAVTGTALANIGGTDMKASSLEGSVDGDNITFVETLDYSGTALRITYKGTVTGDEMNLTRDVAGQGGETLTATRAE